MPRGPRPRNVWGIVGLSMVCAATVLSPTGFLVMPLCLLVPLGFGGLVVCAISLVWKPRWMGAVGLVVGTLCITGWTLFFYAVFSAVNTISAGFGLSMGEHTTMAISAESLAQRAERLRLPDGSPAAAFDFNAVPLEDQDDPWGNPYRYVLVPTRRGYSFFSDGPDGLPDTPDDIDLFTLQTDGVFRLPPIAVPHLPDEPAGSDESGVPDTSDSAATPVPPDR